MDFSEESDNICTPSPPRIKSLREDCTDHCLQSPDKPTATKRTACKRTTKGPNKTKRGQTRPKPKNSSKQSRKRCPKEQLGPAYFSPPSTPSPPPSPPPSLLTHTTTNHQHSPHNSTNSNSGDPHSLPGKECDTTQETSSFLGSNTGHGKTACASSQLVAPSGHPDISDLFLDPQSPTESQYSEPHQSPTEPQCTSPTDHCSQSLRPAEHGSQSLTHGGELHLNGGVADMCSTNSGCLSNSDRQSLCNTQPPLDCDKHESVCIDDLFA